MPLFLIECCNISRFEVFFEIRTINMQKEVKVLMKCSGW